MTIIGSESLMGDFGLRGNLFSKILDTKSRRIKNRREFKIMMRDVGQIERGEKNIGVQNLELIAKALKIKISKLLED